MNKNTEHNSDSGAIADEMLDEYDFSQAVRGNPYRHLNQSSIKIETPTGNQEVIINTVEVRATVTTDGKVTLQLPPNISPGEHHITLLIQENLTSQAT
jgi:DUF4097 and DUF4098 domain-containing protein YvlB